MDEAGIDLQVLSHSIPGLQAVDAEAGPPLARRTNDRLHEAVQRHPDRFSAFAVVPTANPRAAADELERAVTKLGFKGAMVNGMTGGVFHDDKRFWPIWERAAKLDVPIYIHPALPHPAVIEAYYKDYAQSHPGILRAAWGFTVEIATQGLRFVLSGIFDAYPGLKIILGHMGEGLPFLLWRISHGLRATMKEKTFRDIFCEHFWITKSGFFSDTALVCSMMEIGIDRILFSVDYPFARKPARHRMAEDTAAQPRRHREAAERQRPPSAQALKGADARANVFAAKPSLITGRSVRSTATPGHAP
jgi:2,3-dihydroxybenzoate decarboxylase